MFPGYELEDWLDDMAQCTGIQVWDDERGEWVWFDTYAPRG